MHDEITVTVKEGPEGGCEVLQVNIGKSEWFTVAAGSVDELIAKLQDFIAE